MSSAAGFANDGSFMDTIRKQKLKDAQKEECQASNDSIEKEEKNSIDVCAKSSHIGADISSDASSFQCAKETKTLPSLEDAEPKGPSMSPTREKKRKAEDTRGSDSMRSRSKSRFKSSSGSSSGGSSSNSSGSDSSSEMQSKVVNAYLAQVASLQKKEKSSGSGGKWLVR